MREQPEEPISRRELRRQVFRWTRIHQVYLLPNGHRWRTKTLYRRRTLQQQQPVEVRYLCALHPHIELALLQPPVDYTLPGVIRFPHSERPGRFLILFCPECCGAGYHSLSFPTPDSDPEPPSSSK
ncbi:MAG: hypothetical protein KatS3mg022_2698 [Armatimonadota bacterium]|nr:MAG: hypothetical protein KatS3mg022_2698 [Armatimonadota bacterium]